MKAGSQKEGKKVAQGAAKPKPAKPAAAAKEGPVKVGLCVRVCVAVRGHRRRVLCSRAKDRALARAGEARS